MKSQSSLRIALPTIVYSDFTGVELYLYELSRYLVGMGHDVMILCPRPVGDIIDRTKANGVRVHSFDDYPYDWVPDIIHANEKLPTAFAISRWPDKPTVVTIHSQFSVEEPLVTDTIRTYICIREEIAHHVQERFHIAKDRLHLIYNGFDFERFQLAAKPIAKGADTILFVGTIDAIRRQSIEHLIAYTQQNKMRLRVVGKRYESYLDNAPAHVELLAPRWDVENLFTPDVCQTAGVLLGRSSIEGWISGRPGWIYDIETDGTVKNSKLCPVPDDIEKFNITYTGRRITDLYLHSIQDDSRQKMSQYDIDRANIQSILISRSITQGIMIHDIVGKIDYLENILSDHSGAIVDVRDSASQVAEGLKSVSQQIDHLEKFSPVAISRIVNRYKSHHKKGK